MTRLMVNFAILLSYLVTMFCKPDIETYKTALNIITVNFS